VESDVALVTLSPSLELRSPALSGSEDSCSRGLDLHLSEVSGTRGVTFLGVTEGLPNTVSLSFSFENFDLLQPKQKI
jgi:hypothetical protein